MKSLVLLALPCLGALACDPAPMRDPNSAARPDRAAPSELAQRPAIASGAYSSACDPNAYTCVGDDALEYCGRSGWQTVSCSDVCADAGLPVSLGCAYDGSLGGDACYCDTYETMPSATCTEGWSCADSLTLSYCEDGVEDVWSCDAVCRSSGFDHAAACDMDAWGDGTCYCEDDAGGSTTYGCGYGDEACGDGTCIDASWVCDGYDDCATGADEYGCAQCTFAGGVCNGGNAIDTCEGGAIATWSCDDLCRDSGYDFGDGCAYDPASGGDSCFCGMDAACLADELTCGDGSCVPNDYVCDGYVDCGDGGDEIGCVTECDPGETACTGDYTIEMCDDAGFWVAWDCDDVCQQSGYDYADACAYDAYSGLDSCYCAQ